MDPTMQVVVGWLAFGGSHTALSHPPVRSRLVARLGERGFLLFYSLVALGVFVPLVWTFFANRIATPIPLPVLVRVPGVAWGTMALMLVAVPLIVLGFASPNPVSALTGRAGSGATGALRITRHPGFMGVALAGLAHLLVNRAPIDRAFFGGLVLYCVVGCWHQDGRRRNAAGTALAPFFAETSFLPFVAILQGRNRLVLRELRPVPLAASLGLYALLFNFHHRIFGG
ncbi:MAG: NnrU family protein [Myxococcota bacterium]